MSVMDNSSNDDGGGQAEWSAEELAMLEPLLGDDLDEEFLRGWMQDGDQLGDYVREMASEAGPQRTSAADLQEAVELHVCMGLNACNGHDCDRNPNLGPGEGQCATALHACHGANECRGQGGCGYTGPDAELAKPGEQACRQNGSCASPINISRVFAGGPLKGKSVWKLARQLFEARMYAAGIAFGSSPGEGYDDDLVPAYEQTEKDRRRKKLELLRKAEQMHLTRGAKVSPSAPGESSQ
jgi:ribosomal protein S16